jgi:hypothetical protein
MLKLPTFRVLTMLAINISLIASAPEAYAKPCECKDVGAMTAEIQRVSTAEAAWRETFAWARGLRRDIAEPKSNDELNTKFLQLARAPRSDWDRIIREPIQQIERPQTAGGFDKDGEVIINVDFSKSHCDEIVEGVRLHERTHRDFYLSPGNFIEGGLMSSRHLRLRSESEVVSYRAQKAFLDQELGTLKKRCKKYRATGQDGPVVYSGVICSLDKPFSVTGTHPLFVFSFTFVPSSATAGTASYSTSGSGISTAGSGSYTIEGADTDKHRILWRAQSTARIQAVETSGGGTATINLVPLDTDECN